MGRGSVDTSRGRLDRAGAGRYSNGVVFKIVFVALLLSACVAEVDEPLELKPLPVGETCKPVVLENGKAVSCTAEGCHLVRREDGSAFLCWPPARGGRV